jgi:hypothetical protein
MRVRAGLVRAVRRVSPNRTVLAAASSPAARAAIGTQLLAQYKHTCTWQTSRPRRRRAPRRLQARLRAFAAAPALRACLAGNSCRSSLRSWRPTWATPRAPEQHRQRPSRRTRRKRQPKTEHAAQPPSRVITRRTACTTGPLARHAARTCMACLLQACLVAASHCVTAPNGPRTLPVPGRRALGACKASGPAHSAQHGPGAWWAANGTAVTAPLAPGATRRDGGCVARSKLDPRSQPRPDHARTPVSSITRTMMDIAQHRLRRDHCAQASTELLPQLFVRSRAAARQQLPHNCCVWNQRVIHS